MRSVIKEDILKVLGKAVEALESDNHEELRKLSNQTIHDAGIFQEDEPLMIAVMMYALAKVIENCKDQEKHVPEVIPLLKEAYDYLENNDFNGYHASIKKVLRLIELEDEKIGLFTQEVLRKALIKKGSNIHQHGISIARTAEMLGLSQWELQEYIGKFRLDEKKSGRLSKRLAHTRRLFR